MYQKYSIGKMSKLLGISSEALRYYESKEIIKPIRDAETGYRYYNAWDLHMLFYARHYQSYGLSLEEVADMLRKMDLLDINTQLMEHEQTIENEILYQINLLNSIRQSRRMIREAKESIGVYSLRQRPGLYRMNTQQDYTISNKKEDLELVEEWSKKAPFVYSCAVFTKHNIENNIDTFEFGLGLNEEYAEFLNVEESKKVKYYPPCMCVCTCIPSRSSQYLSLERLKGGLEFIESKGLKLHGDVVTQVVCMAKPKDEYHNWHLVWFPIELF